MSIEDWSKVGANKIIRRFKNHGIRHVVINDAISMLKNDVNHVLNFNASRRKLITCTHTKHTHAQFKIGNQSFFY